MKWFEHDSNARNDLKLKLIKAKYGAEGYGVYFQILEIIGQNIDPSRPDEWGFVEKLHTLDTLAIECGVSTDKLRTMLRYFDEIGLFTQLDGRLYCHRILDRLDAYVTKKLTKDELAHLKSERVRRMSIQTTDTVRTKSHTVPHSTVPHSTPQLSNKLDKANAHVDLAISLFKKLVGYAPTDKKPRQQAWNLTQKITTFGKSLGKDMDEVTISKFMTKYFEWLAKQEWGTELQKMESVKNKLPMYQAVIERGLHVQQ